jgi:hypothetical protein
MPLTIRWRRSCERIIGRTSTVGPAFRPDIPNRQAGKQLESLTYYKIALSPTHDSPLHAGQAHVSPGVEVRQERMVEAHQVQDGGVQVVDMDLYVGRLFGGREQAKWRGAIFGRGPSRRDAEAVHARTPRIF